MESPQKHTRLDTWVFWSLAGLVLVYVVLRVLQVPVVGDEARAFYLYTDEGWLNPFSGGDMGAGNHLLYTWMSGICLDLFGDSVVSLRMPSVIGYVLYALFTWKFSLKLNNRFLRISFWLLMLVNQYLLDFFGLGRGYGLSLGLFLGGAYYAYNYLNDGSWRNLLSGIGLFTLASLANLTIVYPFAVVVGLFVLFQLFWKAWIQLTVSVILGGGVLLTLAKVGMKLQSSGMLYMGEGGSLWNTTIQTFLAGVTDIPFSITSLFFIALMLVWLAISVDLVRKGRVPNATVLFASMFFGTVVGTWVLHLISDVNYLSFRATLVLFPPLILGLVYALDNWQWRSSQWVVLPLLVMPISTIARFNLTHITEWDYEHMSQEFYDHVARDKMGTFSGREDMYYVWNFMGFEAGGKGRFLLTDDYPNHKADYILGRIGEVDTDLYKVVHKDPVSKNVLFERKQRVVFGLQETKSRTADPVTVDEFMTLAEFRSAVKNSRAVKLDITAEIRTERDPFGATLVVQGFDAENNQLCYRSIKLGWFQRVAKVPLVRQSVVLESPPDLELIKVYIWNMRKESFQLVKSEVSAWTSLN